MRELRPSRYYLSLIAFAFLALVIGLIGRSDSAHASSFNPTASACFTTATNPDAATCDGNSAPGARSNILATYEVPLGDANLAGVIAFTPSAFTVPAAADLPIGAIVARLNSIPTLGLINGPCASLLPVNFTFMNASVDVNDTIDPLPYTISNNLQNLAQDANGNGLQDGMEKYPSYLNTLFKNQQPRARYVAFTSLSFASGLWVVLQFLIFEPGASPNSDTLPALDAALGYPNVTVLQDPTQPPSVGAVTDFCTSLKVRTVINGESEDNANTETNEAGKTVRQNPSSDGTYSFILWNRSQRDADGDGLENSLDTCPYAANVENPRKSAAEGGDPDLDGVDSICDPVPGSACTPTALDCDGDQYTNRQDNCPLVANGETQANTPGVGNQTDNDFVFGPLNVGDTIGNACDQNQGTLDGHYHVTGPCPASPAGCEAGGPATCLTAQIKVGAGGATADTDFVLCGRIPVAVVAVGDSDQDGVPDNIDQCPGTPAGAAVDAIGCTPTQAEEDSDNDGVINRSDICPGTPAGTTVDAQGCSAAQRAARNTSSTNPGDGVGGPSSGVGSLSPAAAGIPAWAAIASALGGAGLLGSLGTFAARFLRRRRL